MPKSTFISYLLWLIGGILGLHHVYLGRDRQSFVWWCTCGLFGFGTFRDLWRIPEYVASANEEQDYMQSLNERMRDQPPFSIARFCAELLFGTFLGYLFMFAVPEEFSNQFPIIRTLIVALAISIGIHTVGNIGREEGSIKPALYGSFVLSVTNNVSYQVLFSTIFFQSQRRFRRTPEHWRKDSVCRRLIVLGLAGSLITGAWMSAIAFNMSITNERGETVKVWEAVNHFFKSPFWKDFVKTMKNLDQAAKKQGWRKLWWAFLDSFDAQGEINAYKVLNLTNDASEQEIRKRYRELAKRWHPDKQFSSSKVEAEKMFLQVQEAYETLSSLKSRRKSQHRKS